MCGIEFNDLVILEFIKWRRISASIIDETIIQIVINTFGYGSVLNQLIDLCLNLISEERNMLVAEKFIRTLVD